MKQVSSMKSSGLVCRTGLALLTACGGRPTHATSTSQADVGRAAHDVELRTDARQYVANLAADRPNVLSRRFRVVATVRNATTRSVQLERCTPLAQVPIYGIDMAQPEQGQAAGYGIDWACVDHGAHLQLDAGGTRTDTLDFGGPNTTGTGVRPPMAGWMRVNYTMMCADVSKSCEGGVRRLYSNPFEVVLAPP
jgi:hypothetical protein